MDLWLIVFVVAGLIALLLLVIGNHHQHPAPRHPSGTSPNRASFSRMANASLFGSATSSRRVIANLDLFLEKCVQFDAVPNDNALPKVSSENAATSSNNNANNAGEISYRPRSESVVSLLKMLAKSKDLYTVIRVTSDAEEQSVLKSLETLGLFSSGLNRHKVLFCETAKGKEAITRQIEPQIYIDDDPSVVKILSPHVPSLVLVVPSGVPFHERLADNVAITDSLQLLQFTILEGK